MSCTIQFDLLYEPNVAGGFGYRCEKVPLWLQIFASHEFRPYAPTTLQYTSSEPTKRSVFLPLQAAEHESQVYAPLRDAGGYESFTAVGRKFVPGRASRSSCIVFNAYATTYTEDNNPVTTRVGAAAMTMPSLLQAAHSGYPLKLRLLQSTKNSSAKIARATGWIAKPEPVGKGYLTISNICIQDKNLARMTAEQFERDVLLPSQPLDLETEKQIATVSVRFRELIIDSMAAFATLNGRVPKLATPTLPFLMHFHCPEWRLRCLSVPAFAYLAYRSHAPSALSFFLQAQDVALRRSQLTVQQALEFGRLITEKNSARFGQRENAFLLFVSRLVTLLANAMAYLDDFVNTNVEETIASEANIEIVEDMKSARVTRADDCEGTALEALLECIDMVERMSVTNSSPEYLLLKQVAAVLSLYVPCLSLFVVTNKKAVPAKALGAKGEDVPAHTISLLIPYHRFEKWVSAHISKEKLRATKFYRMRATALEQWAAQDKELPLLLLDGTARSDPEMLPLSEYFNAAEKTDGVFERAKQDLLDRIVLTDKILEFTKDTRLSTELFSSEEELTDKHKIDKSDVSDFYKLTVKVQTLATVELGMCDFTTVYLHPPAERSSWGVFFNDFVRLSDDVGLVPYLHAEPIDMAKIDMVLAAEEFVPPLATTSSAVSTLETIDERLTSLARGDESYRCTITPSGGTHLHPRVIVLSARAQDIDENEVVALQAIASLSAVKRVTVDIARILDAVSSVGGALDIVDVTCYF
jgi:hypothetical protein